MRYNLSYFIFFILIFPLFFPYVGFLKGTDIQVFYLLSLIIFMGLVRKRIFIDLGHLSVLILSFLVFYIYFLIELLFYNLDINFFSTYSFLFFSLIYLSVFYRNFSRHITYKLILVFLFIYVFVAFIQKHVYIGFLSFLMTRGVEQNELLLNSGRGVASLTSEPSKFSQILIFFNLILIYLLSFDKIKYLYRFDRVKVLSWFLLLVNIYFSMSFHYVLLHLFFLVIIFFKSYKLYISILLIVAFSYLINFLDIFNESYRIVYILNILIHSPELLTQQGAFGRATNVFSSLAVFFQNPFGIGSYGSFKVDLNFLFFEYIVEGEGRLYGGVVEYLTRFGLFSLVLLSYYFFLHFQIFSFLQKQCFRFNIFAFVFSIFILTFIDGSIVDPYVWGLIFFVYFDLKRRLKFKRGC